MSKKNKKHTLKKETVQKKSPDFKHLGLQLAILGFAVFMSSYITRASIYSAHPELIPDPEKVAVAAEPKGPDSEGDNPAETEPIDSTVVGAYGPKFLVINESDIPVIFTEDEELQAQLVEAVKKRPGILDILNNADAYEDPEGIITFLLKEPEAYEFIKNLPTAEPKVSGGITDSEMEEEFPLFVQWDTRWGYMPYGGNIMATSGCAPTAVSMIAVALTRDSSISPDVVANYCTDKNLYVKGIGTSWNFFTKFVSEFGLKSKVIFPSEDNLIKAVNAGHPVLMSLGPGDFTDNGHIAVITGYKNGKFEIRDPGSVERSNKLWDYYTLAKQLKGTWEFSLSSDHSTVNTTNTPVNTEDITPANTENHTTP